MISNRTAYCAGSMNLAILALIILFAVPMALWPVLWLFVLGRHALSRRWQRVGQVALLLPLWTIAASVAALQFPRLLVALNAEKVPPGLLFAAVAIGVATCFATIAWLLLIRSFRAGAVQNP
ncbi:hypothetical protein HLB44_26470 [Aquincola sp. S2]|uniref:Uncharacterized protein n=1 Tax=Pseudaquabacterium terrae TaxID=2732868 RepID=A0ABX2EPT9_9BURK|nr:hypothetical protein [Aquabacterium terrae]NRF70555.1 hypothetical protein [Aquabacterium terrae]